MENPKKVKIINLNGFCKFHYSYYNGKEDTRTELGVATLYFAGMRWKNPEEYEKTSGSSFGWVDQFGKESTDNKVSMTRPTLEEVEEGLEKFPELKKAALKEGLIELEG